MFFGRWFAESVLHFIVRAFRDVRGFLLPPVGRHLQQLTHKTDARQFPTMTYPFPNFLANNFFCARRCCRLNGGDFGAGANDNTSVCSLRSGC